MNHKLLAVASQITFSLKLEQIYFQMAVLSLILLWMSLNLKKVTYGM